MTARSGMGWLELGWETWALGVEASTVIGLRAMKFAVGGAAAETEAMTMVAEKLQAGMALQAMALTGGLGLNPQIAAARTVSHYRRKVRANRRRLLKA